MKIVLVAIDCWSKFEEMIESITAQRYQLMNTVEIYTMNSISFQSKHNDGQTVSFIKFY